MNNHEYLIKNIRSLLCELENEYKGLLSYEQGYELERISLEYRNENAILKDKIKKLEELFKKNIDNLACDLYKIIK